MLAFMALEKDLFHLKINDKFPVFAPSIKCGCSLELPREGESNEYLQSMFFAQNRRNSIHRQTQLLAV